MVSSRLFVVNEHGKKTAVLLSIKEYENLLEDIHDLALAYERKDDERFSLEEVKRKLLQDGILPEEKADITAQAGADHGNDNV